MMKLVYSVLDDIKKNPAKVDVAQKLTLNARRPQGLKGTYGLYGSQEWLDNLQAGRIPHKEVKGSIKKVYKVGMYESDLPNTIEVETEERNIEHISIYTNNDSDILLFQEGKRIEVLYFIEELKLLEETAGKHKTHAFVHLMKVEN